MRACDEVFDTKTFDLGKALGEGVALNRDLKSWNLIISSRIISIKGAEAINE